MINNQINEEMFSYPYFFNTLSSLKGKRILVQTVKDNDTGYLLDVFPDHIVIKDQQNDPANYILISKIVSVMVLDRF